MSLIRTGVTGALLVAAAVACGGGHDGGGTEPPSPPIISSISVTAPSAPIASYEDTVRLVVTPRTANGTPVPDAQITWTSSDTSVASVASTGTVTAHHNGTTTVTASVGSVTAQATVTVQQVPAKLAFGVQPGDTRANTALAVAPQVQVQDARGHVVENATTQITLAPTGTNAGVLGGTTAVAAVNGVATFPGLTLAHASNGVTLTATAAATTPAVMPAVSAPFNVALDIVEISAGAVTTCARTTDGTAYCWGNNDIGRVGDGTTISRPTPVRVAGGLKFTTVQAGNPFACGLVQGGTLYCWGGVDGGNNTNSLVPVVMTSPVSLSALSIGWHGCGLDASNVAYCWRAAAYSIGAGWSNGYPFLDPTLALGGGTVRSITAGISFTCGVLTGGGPVCTGNNSQGELGNGNTTTTSTAAPVVGGLNLTVVAAGDEFACGVTSSGAAWCWGNNNDGQLGTGTASTFSSVPVAVIGGITFTTIDAGGNTTCGLASSGTAYCWGRGGYGQLGNGRNESMATPVAVSGHRFTSISVGSWHVCGIATDGVAYCWGANDNGALGTGGGASSNVPVRVSPPAS